MQRVFISYSSKDRKWVEEVLAARLEVGGTGSKTRPSLC
jgi:hypothetical protein